MFLMVSLDMSCLCYMFYFRMYFLFVTCLVLCFLYFVFFPVFVIVCPDSFHLCSLVFVPALFSCFVYNKSYHYKLLSF